MMRPSPPASTVSLLLFLQLASSLPILPVTLPTPQDCHHTSCLSINPSDFNKHTPPPSSPLSDPHFPSHQLSISTSTTAISNPKAGSTDTEITIDNHALTPTITIATSVALSASHPLSSAFLLSLANPASKAGHQHAPVSDLKAETTSSNSALPSKPSSALSQLRKEDADRYWATLPSPEDANAHASHCTGLRAVYTRITKTRLLIRKGTRGFEDLIVVGIVVLFLACVVVLEWTERVRERRSLEPQRAINSGRKGDIYLEDYEKLPCRFNSFFSITAPSPRHNSDSSSENENGYIVSL